MTDPLSQTLRPNIQAFLNFDEADLFGPEMTEQISCTSHLDALEQMLDESHLPETADVRAWLTTEQQFWTLAAYKREKISDGDLERWAQWHMEHLRETFGEDYGNDEGDDGLSDEDIKELDRRAEELVKWYASKAKVWRCEQLRTFTFDAGDVLEMVEQLRPDWLNKGAPGDV